MMRYLWIFRLIGYATTAAIIYLAVNRQSHTAQWVLWTSVFLQLDRHARTLARLQTTVTVIMESVTKFGEAITAWWPHTSRKKES